MKSYDAALADLQKSPYADMAPRFQLYRTEMVAWQQYAEGQNDAAVATMRKAADEQDKLGQAEVDLPAREMLGDMLMELNRPKEALVEYKVALTLSPNRLNGLYGAARAAEALGMKKEAGEYYAAMLKNTGDGARSSRPSLGCEGVGAPFCRVCVAVYRRFSREACCQSKKIREAAMAAASLICNRRSSLYADRFRDLDVDRGEPVVAVGAGAVDDAEELVVQRLGDGTHAAVADQDAVDRA